MWNTIKNALSYLWYVLTMDWFQLISTAIDILILLWTVICWREVVMQPSLLLVVLAVLVNFIWQVFNVAEHFEFLKKENPASPLVSLLKDAEHRKDFSRIGVKRELYQLQYPYDLDLANGVLENHEVSKILSDTDISIKPLLSRAKMKETRTYIRQYQETLLKFLNHKWYEVSQNGGKFTNDRKICFASEVYQVDGALQWRITKGCYYNGYLTNTIFTQYIGGSHYKLYPPMNMLNTPICPLGDSDFSDHIGVSTLLYTADGYVVVFRQAGNAGQYPNKYVSSGSGSLDFADFDNDVDIRTVIIRGAERELGEESSLAKNLLTKDRDRQNVVIDTKVLRYYRDMERGGKPEFCCISMVNKPKDFIKEYVSPSVTELANEKNWKLFADDDLWQDEILPYASLSLKMNYMAVRDYMEKR
jgi:hypothetical protein